MPVFLGKDYYCHTCKKSYKCRDKHRCPNKCLACFKTEQHTGDKIMCGECNRLFFGQKCYDEHLRNHSKGKKRDIVCGLVQKCLKCNRTVSDLSKHKINGDVMGEVIRDPSKTITIEKKGAITRDPKTKTIVNQDQTKTFCLGYDKHVVQDDFDTLPYGF